MPSPCCSATCCLHPPGHPANQSGSQCASCIRASQVAHWKDPKPNCIRAALGGRQEAVSAGADGSGGSTSLHRSGQLPASPTRRQVTATQAGSLQPGVSTTAPSVLVLIRVPRLSTRAPKGSGERRWARRPGAGALPCNAYWPLAHPLTGPPTDSLLPPAPAWSPPSPGRSPQIPAKAAASQSVSFSPGGSLS